MLFKIIQAIIATLIAIFAFIITTTISSLLDPSLKGFSLQDLPNILGPNIFLGILVAIFASFLFLNWSITYIVRNELVSLTKEITSSLNSLNNEIIVLQEIDKNLNNKISLTEDNYKKLEERIIALEKLILELTKK